MDWIFTATPLRVFDLKHPHGFRNGCFLFATCVALWVIIIGYWVKQ